MNLQRPILFLILLVFLVACSSDTDEKIEPKIELKAVTNDIVLFEYTKDTGNNSSKLVYEIKFSNPNEVDVNGFHKVKINADGFITTSLASNLSPCYLIEANSDCTIFFENEASHDNGFVNSLELVSVEYELLVD